MNKAWIFLVILILPLVAGLTYKQNTDVDVKIPCTIDGAPCTASANCNLSVQYPNSTYCVDNIEMSFNPGGDFNYSTVFTELGTHTAKASCTEAGQNATTTFNIVITTTGVQKGNTLPLFLLLGAIIMFVVALTTKNWVFGFLSGIIFAVGGIYMMIYGFETVADLYTRTIAAISLGFGLILLAVSAYEGLGEHDDLESLSEY